MEIDGDRLGFIEFVELIEFVGFIEFAEFVGIHRIATPRLHRDSQ
jgi:hypothetical protein